MKVKICGVTREADARLACELGAWAVGLVFAPKSPRRLTLSQASKLRKSIGGAWAVGVFQDAPREEIVKAISECGLDAVQLHGGDCAGYPVPVIKAFGLNPGEKPALTRDLFAALLEPARSEGDRRAGKKPGPEAQAKLWETAAGLKGQGPMIVLAGGLAPENVAQAVRAASPDAVDVSGGVESSFGVKDAAKLRAFFAALS